VTRDDLYLAVDEIGVVGDAWSKLKETLKKIIDSIPNVPFEDVPKKRGPKRK